MIEISKTVVIMATVTKSQIMTTVPNTEVLQGRSQVKKNPPCAIKDGADGYKKEANTATTMAVMKMKILTKDMDHFQYPPTLTQQYQALVVLWQTSPQIYRPYYSMAVTN